MPEPSNTSVQGLIGSLGATGKASAEKGGIRQGSDKQEGDAFSRELGHALEKHTAATQPANEKAAARQEVAPGIVDTRSSVATPSAKAVAGADLLAASSTADGEELVADSSSSKGLELPLTELAHRNSIVADAAKSDETVAAAPEASHEEIPTAPMARTSEAVAVTDSLKAPNTDPESVIDPRAVQAEQTDVAEQTDPSLKLQIEAPGIVPEQAMQVAQSRGQSESSEHAAGAVLSQPAADASSTTSGKITPATGDGESSAVTMASPGSRSTSVPTAVMATQPLASTATTVSPLSPQTSSTPLASTLAEADGASPVVQASESKSLPITRTPSVSMPELEGAEPGQSGNRTGTGTAAQGVSATVTAAALANSLSASGVEVDAESTTVMSSSPVVTQPAEVGEVISQASLAARYRYVGNGSDSQNSASLDESGQPLIPASGTGIDGKSAPVVQRIVTPGAVDNSLTQPGADKGADAAAMPLNVNDTAAQEGENVLRHADLLKDIQAQRAVLSDTASTQGAQASVVTGETLARSVSADNMLLPATGGIVTAPVLQRSDAVTGSPVNAPFDLSLLSEDAETGMASNVKWMVKEGVQNATVTVTPSGMGPISVKVGIEQDQMNVSILASQHTTREALDAMLPRLREQLAAQGHENVKLDVSDGRGDQSRGGNGQMFAGTRNPSDSWTQREQGNSGGNDNQAEYGSSSGATGNADAHMAEDLQRVVLSSAGASGTSSAFDAYV